MEEIKSSQEQEKIGDWIKGIGIAVGIFLISWILLGATIYIYKVIAHNKNMIDKNTLKYLTNIGYDNRIISFMYCITVVSASAFSFFLYRATKRSIEISIDNKVLQEKTMKLTQSIAARELEKENKKIKTNAFIMFNDLKICSDFMAETLITYANENSKITIEKDERDNWINDWKPILRKFIFTHNWRETLQCISEEVNKINEYYTQELYRIYVLLETSNIAIDNCDNLHKKIELIPKESIFSKEFLEKYNNLRYSISEYDEMKYNISQLELSLKSVPEYEIVVNIGSDKTNSEKRKTIDYKNIENEIKLLQIKMENKKHDIYKRVDFFKNLESNNREILNEKFAELLRYLHDISKKDSVK